MKGLVEAARVSNGAFILYPMPPQLRLDGPGVAEAVRRRPLPALLLEPAPTARAAQLGKATESMFFGPLNHTI